MRLAQLVLVISALATAAWLPDGVDSQPGWRLEVSRLTQGPQHHFFGYIGHAGTIPWSGDGRFFLALRTPFQDRMPEPAEPADVVVIDTLQDNRVIALDTSRAWNFQQGTMFYWNPDAPATQFFFNDRDPATQKVFTVLYDVTTRRRLREYRFDDLPVANGGVAQKGGRFLALNYGRMARLRPVTGYPGAFDGTSAQRHPDSDGIHLIDVATGARRLLVSFSQLAALVRTVRPDVDGKALFINHTLWSRDDTRIYFYVRADFDTKGQVDIPCTIRPDGTGLRMLDYIGGHPEWADGHRLIGVKDGRQVFYDVDRAAVVGTIGTTEALPVPGGDVALSPDGRWLVNGFSADGTNRYAVLQLADGSWMHTAPMSRGPYRSGSLRVDGAPAWNRSGTAFAFPAIDPADGTRQTFVARIVR